MPAAPNSDSDSWSTRQLQVAGGVAVAIGVLALAGWALDISPLTTWKSGTSPMAPISAFLSIAGGTAIFLSARPKPHPGTVRFSLAAGWVTLIAAIALFAFHDFIPSGPALFLIRPTPAASGALGGYVAPVAALGFLIASGTFLILLSPETRSSWPSWLVWSFVLITTMAGGLGALGGILGIRLAINGDAPPAVATSVSLLIMGIALAILTRSARRVEAPGPHDPQQGLIVYAVIFTGLAASIAAEAYAYYRNEAEQLTKLNVVGFAGVLLFGLGAILGAVRRHQRRQFGKERAVFTETARESEERLRLALDAAGQGLWDLNVQTGETIVSSEYASMLGYDPAEFRETHESWRERVHPAERDAVAKQYDDYIAGRLPVNRVECRLRTKDGSWKWILSQGKLVSRTADGKPLRMVGTHVDITTIKLAEARVERLAKLYAALSACNESIVHSIVHAKSEAELFPQVCEAAVTFGGLAMAWIGLVDRESQLVVPVASRGAGSEYLSGLRISADANDPLGRGPTGSSIRENTPFWCDDFAHDPRTEAWHEQGTRFGWAASAALPLMRGGHAVGALTVYAFSVDVLDAEGRKLLLQMASDVSFALDAFDREAKRAATEAELAESELRYRTVFSDSNVPRLLVDPADMRIVDSNPAASEFYGYPAATLMQMNITDLNTLAPEKVRDVVNQIASEKQTRVDFVHRLANGEKRNVEAFSTNIVLHNRPLLLTAIFDVTQRIRTERALQDSLERFRAIFDEAPLGVALIESLTGRIREVNPRFVELTGRTKEELTTIDWMSITHPDDVQEDLSNMVRLNAGEIRGFNMNKRYRRPDGSYVWINMTVAAMSGGPGGVRQHVCMIEDIAERKRNEEEIGRLARIVNVAPNAVTIHDDDGRILFANWRAFEALGYSEEEFLALNLRQLYRPADQHLVAERVQELKEHGEAVFEVELIRKDGTVLPMEVAATVIEWAGQKKFLSVGTDITERKRAEADLRESLQEKEALLKEVHHRVKNNLQLISSMLRLETGRNSDPVVESTLGDMQNRVLSMALLHETLYRSGRFARVDLAAYLGELGNRTFRSLAATGNVTLQADLAPTTVEFDQAIPCGLLVNELMTNALKHAFPDGRIGEVRLALHPVPGSRGSCLEVSDNGVGLPADFAERRKNSLGLQLVDDLTRQLHGTLEIGAGPGVSFKVLFTPKSPAVDANHLEKPS